MERTKSNKDCRCQRAFIQVNLPDLRVGRILVGRIAAVVIFILGFDVGCPPNLRGGGLAEFRISRVAWAGHIIPVVRILAMSSNWLLYWAVMVGAVRGQRRSVAVRRGTIVRRDCDDPLLIRTVSRWLHCEGRNGRDRRRDISDKRREGGVEEQSTYKDCAGVGGWVYDHPGPNERVRGPRGDGDLRAR